MGSYCTQYKLQQCQSLKYITMTTTCSHLHHHHTVQVVPCHCGGCKTAQSCGSSVTKQMQHGNMHVHILHCCIQHRMHALESLTCDVMEQESPSKVGFLCKCKCTTATIVCHIHVQCVTWQYVRPIHIQWCTSKKACQRRAFLQVHRCHH